ncbi:hypothetical protein AVEN_69126-1 [Araneus ventricosus]|uniref:Uncharacterized protein n=1 Tax=Araneus ventricosus TaxID=182803 RepID=A0A4Y2HTQ8_ARAVE|nr:hypothetical protein AVEN_69126-1 [Araneus ventricosus]
MQHENRSRSSPKFQSRPAYSRSEELHKYNSATDDIRNITCWACEGKGHASFLCNLQSPQPGSPIAPPRNIPRFSQDSNKSIKHSFFAFWELNQF